MISHVKAVVQVYYQDRHYTSSPPHDTSGCTFGCTFVGSLVGGSWHPRVGRRYSDLMVVLGRARSPAMP